MTTLHRTYQPGCFYTDFDKLPEAAQKILKAAPAEVECSSYTVWNYSGFIRAEVEIDGQSYDAEISFGDLEPHEWRPEGAEDDDSNDDQLAENILNELVATSELEHMTVHLTLIDDEV